MSVRLGGGPSIPVRYRGGWVRFIIARKQRRVKEIIGQPWGLPDVFDRIPPPMNGAGDGGNIREGRAALCKGEGGTARRLDADGPGFAEGEERGQARRWRAGPGEWGRERTVRR